MARITALLIVFVLAGSPAANAACLGWCGSHQATSQHCHGHATQPGGAVISSTSECAALVAEGPFLRIEPVSSQVAIPAVIIHHRLPLAARAARPLAWSQAVDAALSPPLVLRL